MYCILHQRTKDQSLRTSTFQVKWHFLVYILFCAITVYMKTNYLKKLNEVTTYSPYGNIYTIDL